MSTIAAALRPIPFPTTNVLRKDPAAQAFLILRIAFTVAPILFGLDKSADLRRGPLSPPRGGGPLGFRGGR